MVANLTFENLRPKVTSEFRPDVQSPFARERREGELAHAVDARQQVLTLAVRLVLSAVRCNSRKVYYERLEQGFSKFVDYLSTYATLHHQLGGQPHELEDFWTTLANYDEDLHDNVEFAHGLVQRARNLVTEEVHNVPLLDPGAAAADQEVARSFNATLFVYEWSQTAVALASAGKVDLALDVRQAIERDLVEVSQAANEFAMAAWRLRHQDGSEADD